MTSHSIDRLIRAALLTVFVPLALSCLQPIHADTGFEKQTVLARGEDAGAWAIPKLVRTPKGNALIVLQDRQGGDWGKPILPVALRSVDAGQHWSAPRPLLPTDFPRQDDCIFKPTGIVVDDEKGRIFVFISRAPLRKPDGGPLVERDFYRNIQATRAQGRAWFVIESTDDGITWSHPKEITQQLIKKPHWQEWSPVHSGIQMTLGKYQGRLVVPVRCHCPPSDPSPEFDSQYQTNGIIYSDDHDPRQRPFCLFRHLRATE